MIIGRLLNDFRQQSISHMYIHIVYLQFNPKCQRGMCRNKGTPQIPFGFPVNQGSFSPTLGLRGDLVQLLLCKGSAHRWPRYEAMVAAVADGRRS